MDYSQLIPILYPSMPKELLVQIFLDNESIISIDATIDNILIVFLKNADGKFTTATINEINKPYLAYIIRQLNRMFGD